MTMAINSTVDSFMEADVNREGLQVGLDMQTKPNNCSGAAPVAI